MVARRSSDCPSPLPSPRKNGERRIVSVLQRIRLSAVLQRGESAGRRMTRPSAKSRRMKQACQNQWLTIVGIGEDGVEGLGDEAKRRIAEAEIVFGGKRHLALVGEHRQRARARPGRARSTRQCATCSRLRGRKVCVLASGDPFCMASARRWRGTCAGRRNAGDPCAVGLLACRGAARLGAAGCRDGVAARPRRST